MVCKVELIPVSEGNRIIIKENEKIIAGRGSSLGCNDKKISRQHAELLLKKDETLWIKPMHTNPVFYRPLNCKTIQLTKDVEQELKDGDQIGLLPTSFFFRVSFTTDINNNKDELTSKCVDNHTVSESIKDVSSKTKSSDVEPKPSIQDADTSASSTKNQDESESTNSDKKSRALPNWMATSTSTSSSPHKSTSDDGSNSKRKSSSEGDDKSITNEPSTTSDKQSSASTKSSLKKTFDSDSGETFDSVSPKKLKSNDKPRPVCSYGASCYRKNLAHRTEQSHPGDSDYEDEKDTTKDNNDADKPQCPYGKTCYRQNPQHKLDYKH